jgi:WD40 repeat protein
MSGRLVLHGPRSHTAGTDVEVLALRHDHLKYAVQVSATNDTGSDWIIATAGWDQRVHIYSTPDLDAPGSQLAAPDELLRDPAVTIALLSNPESFVFVRHPDSNALHLVLSRRDSTHLYYYHIDRNPSENRSLTVREAGKQNLAPHANAWIAFSPSCLALSPTDPSLLAVATSHLPHMKLIVVRLLFPDSKNAQSSLDPREPPQATQASQARAALAISDREDAAISLHVSTMAPQTPYSTPQVVWRPDGSGVWVSGDDGVVRGVEVMAGKVVAQLKGHDAGTKVRSLWAGMMSVSDDTSEGAEEGVAEGRKEEEWLVSGGFDKKVIVWKIEKHRGGS